jgi:hypothetical protein
MAYLSDCTSCKQANPVAVRQSMGCGYESPTESPIVWTPEGMRIGSDDKIRHCAGYTTRLPEVIEIARARTHWDKGHLVEFCGGQPTQPMMIGIEIIDASAHQLESALMTPRSKGGLRDE